MRLTAPTNYVFFSSVVLVLAALVLYFVGMIGLVEDPFHAANAEFWIAIVAWLAMAVGVAAKGI